MNKTVIKGGGGVKRPRKMLILFVKKGEGGKKVMTVLFIRENVDNYGWPLTSKISISL